MRLFDLAAYAREKYHITEQFRWPEHPGYSVLVDPYSEKWAALLMRRWDPNLGESIEVCDIWCGKEVLDEYKLPYLSMPYRMHGEPWVGVLFDSNTDPDVVYRLFDKAMQARRLHGFTIIFEDDMAGKGSQYQDTPIPPKGKPFSREDTTPAGPRPFSREGTAPAAQGPNSQGDVSLLDMGLSLLENLLSLRRASSLRRNEPVPLRIREMRQMYRYGDGSFRQKCKNFYVQGKFMEDYEDDAPWHEEFRQYFPTYHDLSVQQLRGYFTWRTKIRKGEYEKISDSLAYLYIYELLNGIGAEAVEERLRKIQEFEAGFFGAGFGSVSMKRALHRWILELAVIHGLDTALVSQYMDPDLMKRDEALMVLRAPDPRSDDEVFDALSVIGGNKIRNSTLIQKKGEEAKHLFSAVWRYASKHYEKKRKDLFTVCFDVLKAHPWHPLASAVYWQQKPVVNADYVLNECHYYTCRNADWKEHCYSEYSYDKASFEGLFHEADRRFRMYLKFGHPLKEFMDDAWAVPFIEAVIEEDRKEKAEALKPKIEIHFENLDRIRSDASKTRDSLLTEEELGAEKEAAVQAASNQEIPARAALNQEAAVQAALSIDVLPDIPSGGALEQDAPLDDAQIQVLTLLLQEKSVKEILRSKNVMPEIFADTLNEALYDLIGDTVVECAGDELTLIKDYREDIARILGGNTE